MCVRVFFFFECDRALHGRTGGCGCFVFRGRPDPTASNFFYTRRHRTNSFLLATSMSRTAFVPAGTCAWKKMFVGMSFGEG